MKWLTNTMLATVVLLGTSGSVLADTMTTVPGGQKILGQVESVNESIVMVKTASGETQAYRVDPGLISALKLGSGSNVVIDGSRLMTGKVVRLDSYTTEIALDQGGEQKSYILTRESRRYLNICDRVVITPDLRIVRMDLYTLTAADLMLQPVMIASAPVVETTSTRRVIEPPVNTGGGEMPAPVVSPPVGGLW
ncbi:MAG: hypothetical protein WCD18_00190 [Thermosynechococcaceae cyanobacterium]